jgi:hypothetical protein
MQSSQNLNIESLEVELNALISSKNQCVGELNQDKNPTAEIISEAEKLIAGFLDLSRQYMQVKDYRKVRTCYQHALELIKDPKQPPNNSFTFVDLQLQLANINLMIQEDKRLEDMDFIPAIEYFENALVYLHTPEIMTFFANEDKKFFELINTSYLIVGRLIKNPCTHVQGKRLYHPLFILLEQFNNEKISEETRLLIQKDLSNLLLVLSCESIKKYAHDAKKEEIIQCLLSIGSESAVVDELKWEKMYGDVADYFNAHQDYAIACRWLDKITQIHDQLLIQVKGEVEKFKILLNKLNLHYKSIMNGLNINAHFKLLTPLLREFDKMLDHPDKYANELVHLAGMHFSFANFLHANKHNTAQKYYTKCFIIIKKLSKVNNLPHQLQIDIALIKMDELIRSLNPDIKKLELKEIQDALNYIDSLCLVFYPLNCTPEPALVRAQIKFEDKCDRLITQMLKKKVIKALESPLLKESGVNSFSQLLCGLENKTEEEIKSLSELESATEIRKGMFKLFTPVAVETPLESLDSSNSLNFVQ